MDPAIEGELNDLRFHWDEAYDIAYDEKAWTWSARFKGADYELVARTGGELRRAIRLDYQERRHDEIMAIKAQLEAERSGAKADREQSRSRFSSLCDLAGREHRPGHAALRRSTFDLWLT